MSSEVEIRFAIDLDVGFLDSFTHISVKTLQHKIDRQEIIVAVEKGVLVGFIQLEYLWSLVPYIALIRVVKEHQRQGIGKKMLVFTELFLKSKEHQILYSSSQADEPHPQEWHRHAGFKECGMIAGINEGVGEIFFQKKI